MTLKSSQRSIQLKWTPGNPADDVGMITWYIIEFNNQSYITTLSIKYPTSTLDLTSLKPYTKYFIRINAISAVGQGLWSGLKTVGTTIAGNNLFVCPSVRLSLSVLSVSLSVGQFFGV
jgi:hypothetical protein